MEVFKAASKQGLAARDSIAIRADQKSYSYGGLVSAALRISALLSDNETSGLPISGHGSLRGARIGIVAKPSAEFVAGVLGTWFSGGVAVPLALSYPESELFHVMNDSVCPGAISFSLIQFMICQSLSKITRSSCIITCPLVRIGNFMYSFACHIINVLYIFFRI